MSTPVALALGSNLGHRSGFIHQALAALREGGLHIDGVAPIMESAPLDCPAGSPPFLNTALVGAYAGTAQELLQLCQQVERLLGRERGEIRNSPRTIDVDILLFGQHIIATPELCIPHPQLQRRQFVLEPLTTIAPAWIVPGSGLTVHELWRALQPPSRTEATP